MSTTFRHCIRLALFFAAIFISTSPFWVESRRAAAQQPDQNSDVIEELKRYLAGLDKEENGARRMCFSIVKRRCPAGAVMTSGYRSPEEQLNVIRYLAGKYSEKRPDDRIQVPNPMTLKDANSWLPVLTALRAKGLAVNAPLPGHSVPVSQHTNRMAAVFDVSGAPLGAIAQACKAAVASGELELNQCLIEDKNDAVHIDVKSVTAKGLNLALQLLSGGELPLGAVSDPLSQDVEKADFRNALKDSYQFYYDQEKDPVRKIGYLEKMVEVLRTDGGAANRDQIATLTTKIEVHRGEIEKGNLLRRVREFIESRRLDDAENVALEVRGKSDDDQTRRALAEVKIEKAMDAYLVSNCELSDKFVGEAQVLIEKDSGAAELREKAGQLKNNIGTMCSESRVRGRFKIGLYIALSLGALVGLYFLFRPSGQWAIEIADGPNRGELHPMEQAEAIVGSLGAPEGEADIVINDRKQKISKTHCKIYQDGRKLYIKDLSRNGTKVSGRLLEEGEYCRLRKGDEISLADVAILTVHRKSK